ASKAGAANEARTTTQAFCGPGAPDTGAGRAPGVPRLSRRLCRPRHTGGAYSRALPARFRIRPRTQSWVGLLAPAPGRGMGYWLTAIAAAALTIAAGWFFLLNGGPVVVRLAPSRTIVAPLGGALLGAFFAGGAVVGLLATAGAGVRGWRAMGERRRTRREARRAATRARAPPPRWARDARRARAELLRAPEPPESDASRLALLAEAHLQEGDPAAAREVIEGGLPQVGQDPRLLDLLARAAEELGDQRAALDALERANRALPESP